VRADRSPSTTRTRGMATIFSRIIAGEIPGRFLWSDEACVAFLTIEPLAPGHTLVVPRREVDHWIDLDRDLNGHLFDVARLIGDAIRSAFSPHRARRMVQGSEVPPAHLHVWPANSPADLDRAAAERSPAPDALDSAGEQLRSALHALGYGESAPENMARP